MTKPRLPVFGNFPLSVNLDHAALSGLRVEHHKAAGNEFAKQKRMRHLAFFYLNNLDLLLLWH